MGRQITGAQDLDFSTNIVSLLPRPPPPEWSKGTNGHVILRQILRKTVGGGEGRLQEGYGRLTHGSCYRDFVLGGPIATPVPVRRFRSRKRNILLPNIDHEFRRFPKEKIFPAEKFKVFSDFFLRWRILHSATRSYFRPLFAKYRRCVANLRGTRICVETMDSAKKLTKSFQEKKT